MYYCSIFVITDGNEDLRNYVKEKHRSSCALSKVNIIIQ